MLIEISSLLFVLSFLFAGASATFLLRLNDTTSFLEWVTLSFSFGFLSLPVLFFVISRFAGGVPQWVPYSVFGVSLVGAVVTLRLRKVPPLRIATHERPLLLIASMHVLTLGLYFSTYPTFPEELLVHDYVQNLAMLSSTHAVLFGWLTTTAYGITQLTSTLFMLFGQAFLQGNPLLDLRYAMILPAAIAPFLVYYVSRSLFKNNRAALLTTVAYSFVFPFWFYGVLSTGLYAQFYAGMLFLLALWMTAEYFEGKIKLWQLTIVLFSFLFAHPTSFLFLGAVSVSCLGVSAAARFRNAKYTKVGAAAGAPLLLSFFVAGPQNLLGYLAGIAAPLGNYSYTPDIISPILSASPFLFVLDNLVGPFTLSLVLVILAIGVVKLLKRSFDPRYVLLFGWLVVAWVVSAPFGGLHTAARYIIFALPVCSLMFGLLSLWVLQPVKEKLGRGQGRNSLLNKWSFYGAVIVLLLMLSTQGALGAVARASVPGHAFEVSKQDAVIQSLYWIKDSTPTNSILVSVALPWYAFSPYISNRSYLGDLVAGPQGMTKYLTSALGDSEGGAPVYVVLFAQLHNSTGSYYDFYKESSAYRLSWNNTMVAVFRYQ